MSPDLSDQPSPGDAASPDVFRNPVHNLKPGPPVIPDHELIRCIGRGSYGEVWLACNVFGKYRAIKLVRRSTFEDDRPFEREFEGIRRFEPISRSHSSQLNVLHVGRNADYFYYVMELADAANSATAGRNVPLQPARGEDITHYEPRTLKLELRRRGRLPATECVDVGLALTTALMHLHAHDLVHRDIKPSNIIFVGGVPKLADIGLVTDVDASRSFVGTEGYLPPEGPGTPQADLYSLGKVLYEMSTGCDRKDYPLLPKDWDAIDPSEQARLLELNEVLVKLCEADTRRRYRSTEQLLVDLEMLQRGRSLRHQRALKRRLLLAKKLTLAAGMLVLLAVGIDSLSEKPNEVASKRLPGEQRNTNSQALKWFEQAQTARRKGTKDGFAQAIDFYNQAIALEPKWAHAHACKAYTYQEFSEWHLPPRQAMTEARAAATRAIEIDESNADAHVILGLVKLLYDWDWLGAEQEFKRAVQLGPESYSTHANYATYLRSVGRLAEARAHQEVAVRLLPTSIHVYSGKIRQLVLERDYDNAIQATNEAQKNHPEHPWPHLWRGFVYAQQRLFEKAVTEFERARSLDESPDLLGWVGYSYAKVGRRDEAFQLLRSLEDRARSRYVSPRCKGTIYVGLGDAEKAIACYQQACEERSGFLVMRGVLGIEIDAEFEGIYSDNRFRALLRKAGIEN